MVVWYSIICDRSFIVHFIRPSPSKELFQRTRESTIYGAWYLQFGSSVFNTTKWVEMTPGKSNVHSSNLVNLLVRLFNIFCVHIVKETLLISNFNIRNYSSLFYVVPLVNGIPIGECSSGVQCSMSSSFLFPFPPLFINIIRPVLWLFRSIPEPFHRQHQIRESFIRK